MTKKERMLVITTMGNIMDHHFNLFYMMLIYHISVMKFLITAFGGGHTSLALACSRRIKDDAFFIILKNDYLSMKKMNTLNLRYKTVIEPRKLGDSLINPIVWIRFLFNAFQSLKILIEENAEILVSTGPNPSIPISLLAKLIGKKLINVEVVDRIYNPSITARFLSFFADETWVHSKKQKEWFRKAKLVGPLFFEQNSGIEIDLPHPIIAVFCGRRSYKELLDAIEYVNEEMKFSWIIQTAGESMNRKKRIIVKDYFIGISDIITQADIVITTGGLTALEILSKNKPLILYPRKDTSDQHQIRQAVYLSKQSNCWCVQNREELKETLRRLRE